jgi:selT/selW/selH-like putative selenoprotein
LAADLLNEYEFEIDQLNLVPARGGRFEAEVNGVVIFSKTQAGRHARSGEILELFKNHLKEITT